MSIYLRIPSFPDPADPEGPPLRDVVGVIDLEMIAGTAVAGIDPADPLAGLDARVVVAVYKSEGAWNHPGARRVATLEYGFGDGLPEAGEWFSDPQFLRIYGGLASYLYGSLVRPGGPHEGAEVMGLPPA
jgi:hypothetical protein